MADPPVPRDDGRKQRQEPIAIDVVEKDDLAAISTCRDVEDAAGGSKSKRSWHSPESTRRER
jgi:hypothetical protein